MFVESDWGSISVTYMLGRSHLLSSKTVIKEIEGILTVIANLVLLLMTFQLLSIKKKFCFFFFFWVARHSVLSFGAYVRVQESVSILIGFWYIVIGFL